MNDKEIAYLIEMLGNSLVKVFYKPGTGDLIPVTSYQEAFLDQGAESAEPVVWLGGSMINKCAALDVCTQDDFIIVGDMGRWPR